MRDTTRKSLIGVIIVLMVGVIFTQSALDPRIREIHAGEKTALQGLSNEFILGPLLGLQQAVAGALWVRADEFFHEGDYDAILPIVRMVTWLDPHQLDVYITGAWHLAYNFTDSSERSDRRYIPASQQLLREGDANNQTVYDIAFELGWENRDKIKNYDEAEKWFRIATQRKGIGPSGEANEDAPTFVGHQLAHALELQGRIDEAIAEWRKLLLKSEAKYKAEPKNYSLRSVRDSEKHNLMLDLKRKFSRYTHEIDWAVDAKRTQSYNPETGEPQPNDAFLATDPKHDGVPLGTPRLPATARPWNVNFDTRMVGGEKTLITFDRPKVMDIKGIFNIGDGGRVNIRLHDEDWTEKVINTFTFDVDQSQTIMQDQLSVRGGQWGRKIDMSRDPKMYSFSRPNYYLVLDYNPRGTSPFLQDKFGWSGEGMTDPKYLWIIKDHPENQKDIRTIRKVYKLSKDQIMGVRPVTEKDVVPNDQYYQLQQAASKKSAAAAAPTEPKQ
jgi:tetratricopeptide (TPR) repeat protein